MAARGGGKRSARACWNLPGVHCWFHYTTPEHAARIGKEQLYEVRPGGHQTRGPGLFVTNVPPEARSDDDLLKLLFAFQRPVAAVALSRIRAPRRRGRSTGNPASRPAPYARHTRACRRCASEGRFGAARPCQRRNHARHLLARHPGDAGGRRGEDSGAPQVGGALVCNPFANRPLGDPRYAAQGNRNAI